MAVYISSCFSRISEYYSSQRFLASVGSDSQIAFTTTSHQKRIAIVKRFDEEDDCTWKISAYFSNFLQKKVAELWMEITGSKRVYIDMVGSRVPSVGIATKLVQTAIEIGLENGCQGHLELESEIHAVEFWKKCGLIPLEEFQMDDSILPMFLPDDQIEHWKEKINADPIFVSTPV